MGGTAGIGGTAGVGGTGATGGSGGTGPCAHDVCTTGAALFASCSPCVDVVCQNDAYCCTTSWNIYCVQKATSLCGECGGTGGTGGGGSCSHDECTVGPPLDPSCTPCTTKVCLEDPFCCDTYWNVYCVNEAKSLCGLCGGAGGTGGGGGTGGFGGAGGSGGTGGGGVGGSGGGSVCAHDECTVGAALPASCSSCAQTVCFLDSFCCTAEWDQTCVDAAKTYCGLCG